MGRMGSNFHSKIYAMSGSMCCLSFGTQPNLNNIRHSLCVRRSRDKLLLQEPLNEHPNIFRIKDFARQTKAIEGSQVGSVNEVCMTCDDR